MLLTSCSCNPTDTTLIHCTALTAFDVPLTVLIVRKSSAADLPWIVSLWKVNSTDSPAKRHMVQNV